MQHTIHLLHCTAVKTVHAEQFTAQNTLHKVHCTKYTAQSTLNFSAVLITPPQKDCTARNSEMQVLHLESRLFTALHFNSCCNLDEISFIWKLFCNGLITLMLCAIVLALSWLQKLSLLKIWRLFFGHILGPFMLLCHVLQSAVHLSDRPRSRGSRPASWMKSAPPREIARTWLSEKKTVQARSCNYFLDDKNMPRQQILVLSIYLVHDCV